MSNTIRLKIGWDTHSTASAIQVEHDEEEDPQSWSIERGYCRSHDADILRKKCRGLFSTVPDLYDANCLVSRRHSCIVE